MCSSGFSVQWVSFTIVRMSDNFASLDDLGIDNGAFEDLWNDVEGTLARIVMDERSCTSIFQPVSAAIWRTRSRT